MSTWYSKKVGDGLASLSPTRRLHKAFSALVKTGVDLTGAAVFSRYDRSTNLVSFYFSPEAALLAEAFGATACEKPGRMDGMCLAVGDPSAFEVHFPGHASSGDDR